MLLRAGLLALLSLATACGGGDGAGQPTQDRTYYCGSYEPLGEGAVVPDPPC